MSKSIPITLAVCFLIGGAIWIGLALLRDSPVPELSNGQKGNHADEYNKTPNLDVALPGPTPVVDQEQTALPKETSDKVSSSSEVGGVEAAPTTPLEDSVGQPEYQREFASTLRRYNAEWSERSVSEKRDFLGEALNAAPDVTLLFPALVEYLEAMPESPIGPITDKMIQTLVRRPGYKSGEMEALLVYLLTKGNRRAWMILYQAIEGAFYRTGDQRIISFAQAELSSISAEAQDDLSNDRSYYTGILSLYTSVASDQKPLVAILKPYRASEVPLERQVHDDFFTLFIANLLPSSGKSATFDYHFWASEIAEFTAQGAEDDDFWKRHRSTFVRIWNLLPKFDALLALDLQITQTPENSKARALLTEIREPLAADQDWK